MKRRFMGIMLGAVMAVGLLAGCAGGATGFGCRNQH